MSNEKQEADARYFQGLSGTPGVEERLAKLEASKEEFDPFKAEQHRDSLAGLIYSLQLDRQKDRKRIEALEKHCHVAGYVDVTTLPRYNLPPHPYDSSPPDTLPLVDYTSALRCITIANGGGCNPGCEVYLDGKCMEPQEMVERLNTEELVMHNEIYPPLGSDCDLPVLKCANCGVIPKVLHSYEGKEGAWCENCQTNSVNVPIGKPEPESNGHWVCAKCGATRTEQDYRWRDKSKIYNCTRCHGVKAMRWLEAIPPEVTRLQTKIAELNTGFNEAVKEAGHLSQDTDKPEPRHMYSHCLNCGKVNTRYCCDNPKIQFTHIKPEGDELMPIDTDHIRKGSQWADCVVFQMCDEIDRLKTEIADAEYRYETVSDALDTTIKERDAQVDEIARLSEAIVTYKESVLQNRNVVARVYKENAELKAENNELRQITATDSSGRWMLVEKYKAENERLKIDKETYGMTIDELRAECRVKSDLMQGLKAENERLMDLRIEDIAEETQEKIEELKDENARLKVAVSDKDELIAEIARLQEQLADEEDKPDLSMALEAACENCDELRAENEDLNRTVDKLDEEIRAYAIRVNDLKVDKSTLIYEADIYRDSLGALKAENERLRKGLASAADKNFELQEERRVVKVDLAQAKAENERLKKGQRETNDKLKDAYLDLSRVDGRY